MNYQSLIKSKEWLEIKDFLKSEIIDKPLDIKTDGLSAERIAIEVLASQLATKKILKAVAKMERLGAKIEIENKSFK
ncbi:MAG: hypothetical protein BWY30_01083 [Tenericutes bacterium ADurb.Bin239]|nr:MAG: hypothetical protein BWY30_01083 [Tenericutes bacterium ADurb.Bin239]